MTLEAAAVLWLRRALAGWLGGREDMTELGGAPPDWAAVQLAAGRHNLEPLLFDLVERGVVAVPAEVRETWEAQYYRNQIFNHSLFETLGTLLAAAEEHGVRVVVLKGPVSIARRLADPGLRVMVDVDLLCRQTDLAVLVKIAMRLGFCAVGENSTYHLALQHLRLGMGLEFHFDLYDVLAARRGFIDEVFSESEPLEVDGFSIRAPAVAAEIVLQLAHLLNHDYRVDLRHWFDFALALADSESTEREFGRLLRLTDLEPEYLEAAAIACGLFGIDLGPRDRHVARAILVEVETGLLDRRDDRALLAGARVHSSWWARAGYVARLLVPSPGRWRALAVSEESGVGTALFRHIRRTIGRGRVKVGVQDQSAEPANSPRARLFLRRQRGHKT